LLGNDQRLVDQAPKPIQGLGPAQRLRRGQRERAREHGQAPEQLLFGWLQQFVTPVDGGSQCVLAGHAAAGGTRKQVEAVLQ
jgi:hypothetical protein